MTGSRPDNEAIFHAARDISNPERRREYVLDACGQDEARIAHVEALLAAADTPDSLLDRPAVGDAVPTSAQPTKVALDTGIGHYKLIEQIGEGGMGTVWMAQQSEPVKRLVALKLIKAGMDSRQVIARFEAERQALALMDHPNIARVLDGGTTEAGRPYFVMDLVRGVPITQYCDEHHLTPRQRLELFLPVCQAVQHAHQKGIIHRDLKPSNVLVALYDGKPVPKVIDFGVAKAAGQPLTEQTLVTGFGQLIGTLEYMSPEQAQFNQLDIDTRSDIYSLGVLLYELLTGTTPLEQARRETLAFDETLRVIREDEPLKPSTRLSTAGTLQTIAANRSMAPAQLRRQIMGDLDRIVMKCLEKDRTRRYETASSLAIDIQHYLHGEPVNACPPSAVYRLKKYLLRNKGSLAVAVGLLVAVLAAAGTLGWALRDRAARELEIARAQSERRIDVERQVRDSLTMARALVAEGKVTSAREKLMQASPELRNDTLAFANLITEVETAQADLDRFMRFLDLIDQANQAETAASDVELAADSTPSANSPPRIRIGERRPEAAIPLLLQALRCYSVLDRDDWQQTLQGGFLALQQSEQIRRNTYEVLLRLANDLVRFKHDYQLMQPLSAEDAAQQALVYLSKAENSHEPTQALYLLRARCRETLSDSAAAQADKHQATQAQPTIAFDHFLHGQAAWDAKRPSEGVEAFEAALHVEPTHYWSMVWLGYCLAALGQPDDCTSAVRVFTGCILKRPDHAHAYYYRAYSYHQLQRYDEALADYTRAITLDPKRSRAWHGRARIHFSKHRYAEALADSSKAIELNPKSWSAWCDRGDAYNSLGQDDKALPDYSKAIELNPRYAPAWAARGVSHNDLNQPDKALADLAKAIELNPRFAYAWNGRGVAHKKLNQPEQALAAFKKAIELDPRLWRAWYDRAVAYKDLNQPEKAVADFSKAIEIDPTLPRAWLGRADCYYRMRRNEEALADYSTFIELDSKTSRAWYARALVHNKLKEREKALADYNMAVELNPRDGSSINNLAWLLATCPNTTLRDPQRAVGLAEKAVEIYPPQGIFWHTLGVARYRVDQWEAAITALEKAQELRGEDPIDWLVLAMCHWKLGHRDRAQTAYENVVQWMKRHQDDLEKNTSSMELLLPFRVEAEALLGVNPSNE